MSELHSTISIGYQSAAEFNTNRSHLLPHGFCFLHTSLSCFISTPLFTLFAQSQMLRYPMILGWAGGPWGERSFQYIGPVSGTLFLSLSSIRLHSLHSKLKTNLSSSVYCHFLSSHLPTHHQQYIYLFCLFLTVCVRAHMFVHV